MITAAALSSRLDVAGHARTRRRPARPHSRVAVGGQQVARCVADDRQPPLADVHAEHQAARGMEGQRGRQADVSQAHDRDVDVEGGNPGGGTIPPN